MKFIDIASKQVDEEAQAMLSDLRDVRVSKIIFYKKIRIKKTNLGSTSITGIKYNSIYS